MDSALQLTPTEFIAVVNQTFEYAYSSVLLVGEVASFKVNQGKWVFFDIKDEESSVFYDFVSAESAIRRWDEGSSARSAKDYQMG